MTKFEAFSEASAFLSREPKWRCRVNNVVSALQSYHLPIDQAKTLFRQHFNYHLRNPLTDQEIDNLSWK